MELCQEGMFFRLRIESMNKVQNEQKQQTDLRNENQVSWDAAKSQNSKGFCTFFHQAAIVVQFFNRLFGQVISLFTVLESVQK